MNDEEKWLRERRAEVLEYLEKEGVKHGQISKWPAWDVYPYTSSWAIESLKSPGRVGWWVICGDHPTDYVSAEKINEPRFAYKSIAESWLAFCNCADEGKKHPAIAINICLPDSIEMLRSRANVFLEWSTEEDLWRYE